MRELLLKQVLPALLGLRVSALLLELARRLPGLWVWGLLQAEVLALALEPLLKPVLRVKLPVPLAQVLPRASMA